MLQNASRRDRCGPRGSRALRPTLRQEKSFRAARALRTFAGLSGGTGRRPAGSSMKLFVNAHARGPTLYIEAELSDTVYQVKSRLVPRGAGIKRASRRRRGAALVRRRSSIPIARRARDRGRDRGRAPSARRTQESHCDIKVDKQILSFKGTVMDDDSASLGSYGVQQDYTSARRVGRPAAAAAPRSSCGGAATEPRDAAAPRRPRRGRGATQHS